jgi:hypothetical protein
MFLKRAFWMKAKASYFFFNAARIKAFIAKLSTGQVKLVNLKKIL